MQPKKQKKLLTKLLTKKNGYMLDIWLFYKQRNFVNFFQDT